MIVTERLTSASAEMLEDINALLQQLRRNPDEPLGTYEDIKAITGDKNVVFVAVKDSGKIVGMATAYLATKLGKRTGFVEDVVIDGAYRGRGLGQKVMETLIDESRKSGATQFYLTSGHDRVAAQKLYLRLGFKKKETNVFKLSI